MLIFTTRHTHTHTDTSSRGHEQMIKHLSVDGKQTGSVDVANFIIFDFVFELDLHI